MINKIVDTVEEAVGEIYDGATIMIGGTISCGVPFNLILALIDKGVRNLTVIANAISETWELAEAKRIKKYICTFPVIPGKPNPLEEQYKVGNVEVEVVPMGTLTERIRAGGAGLPAFWSPVGVGTYYEMGKEKRVFDGKECILEHALKADFALIKGYKGDRMGNLTYRMTARNINPIMATAARVTIAEVEDIEDVIVDPESIVTPGIFVDKVVKARKRTRWFGYGEYNVRPIQFMDEIKRKGNVLPSFPS